MTGTFVRNHYLYIKKEDMENKVIPVTGMACAGCAATVERKLNGMEGVEKAEVNFASRTASVFYDPKVTSPQQMREVLAQAGYDMITDEGTSVEETERRAYRLLLKKAAVSWILAIITMCFSMGMAGTGDAMFDNQAMMIATLANMIYSGRQFYVNAWRQMMHGAANMDTLVALSTAISFCLSVFNTYWGEELWGCYGLENHTYYDASVMIITFVLTGRLLEEKAKGGTASAIRGLMGLAPKTARVACGGKTEEVPIAVLACGDIIDVRQGDRIPVDGIITEGSAYIDESMISGEPLPAERKAGDKVYAGTLVSRGNMLFRAEQVGEYTMLSQIIKTVQQAQGSKAPVQRVTDRIAGVFVPVIIAISLITFAAWMIAGGSTNMPRAVMSAVSVLVIACPCALGLATPTALMVGIGKAAERNILIKDATALERLRGINALVIDKTGTLTIPNKDADFTRKDTLPEERETLKPHAKEAINMLRTEEIDIYMMSGDSEEAAAYWAGKAGISNWRSRVMPGDKEQLVRKLQGEGRNVAMVGDGINDTQALAAADVSIAMGKGTDIAMDVAQVTLMGTDLRRIPEAIRLSHQTVRMIHQNLFWAFIYNIVCIPLAAGVPYALDTDWQITPMWASALMAFSSISVVLISLRLKMMK